MNYLAHAYLSFGEEELLVGNMISDYVKGKQKFNYSPFILKGIMLHRDIDTFTDAHPIIHKGSKLLYPSVGRYSGAFLDIIFDHFLALDTTIFNNDESLQSFATITYQQLLKQEHVLPSAFQNILPYMISGNWLFNYSTESGMDKSFKGLCRRAKYLVDDTNVYPVFIANYSFFQECYYEFFPHLLTFTKAKL